jgi:hypothetical protein
MNMSNRLPYSFKKGIKSVRLWIEVIALGGLIFYSIKTHQMWREVHDQSMATVAIYQRPWVFAKMPTIKAVVGKPVTAQIEIWNFGKGTPAMVRASIHADIGPNVIDNFREKLLDSKPGNEQYLYVPNSRGELKIFLAENEETTSFPIEISPHILTQKEYEAISEGAIDVAVYGRLFYTNLTVPIPEEIPHYGFFSSFFHGTVPDANYRSSFCFYLLRDYTVSACADKPHAYTNFAN